MLYKKGAPENSTKFIGKHPCQTNEAYNFIKKETLTQVFYYEFWEIFKNTFFDRIPQVAASESRSQICQTRTIWATRTKHMQRVMLLYMAPEQLPGKYPIK